MSAVNKYMCMMWHHIDGVVLLCFLVRFLELFGKVGEMIPEIYYGFLLRKWPWRLVWVQKDQKEK